MEKKSQMVDRNSEVLGELNVVELEEKLELSPVGVLVLALLLAAGAGAAIAEHYGSAQDEGAESAPSALVSH